MSAVRNKREVMMELLSQSVRQEYVPAAFFLHFEKSCHFGQAAVTKHLEYFRYTDMDFMKVQYERTFPFLPEIRRPEDWKNMPFYRHSYYEPELEAVRGLVKEAGKEALVLVTLYSPFMCAGHSAGAQLLAAHLSENPEQVRKGFEIVTDSLLLFVRECIRLGVDGFYASTQGGEAGRLPHPRLFGEYVKPFDLILMNEINRSCVFNILHICDYHGPYADLAPFLDYPGHVVNCNPLLASGKKTWKEISRMFGRPCMGGMDRHGIIVTGSRTEIEDAAGRALQEASRPFVLGADCTLPEGAGWENIRAAIAAAHRYGSSQSRPQPET